MLAKRRPEIRPATDADLRAFYERAYDAPWFGLAAETEGVVVGIGGIAWKGERPWLFLDCAPKWMPSPVTAHRLARRILTIAGEVGETVVYAIPSPQVPTAKKWFKLLGFKPDGHEGQSEVWACRDLKS